MSAVGESRVPSASGASSTSTALMTRLVARREFVERIRDRGFLIGAGISVALVVIAVVVIAFTKGGGATTFKVDFAGPLATQEQAVAVSAAQADGVKLDATVVQDASGSTERVRAGKLDALVSGDTVVVKASLDPKLGPLLQGVHRSVATDEALKAAGLDTAKVQQAAATVAPLTTDALVPTNPRDAERKGIAIVGSIILFGQIIGYGVAVATGVVEEKSSRVVEVLLAAVRPRSLLAGKIFGIGALGLLQMVLTALVGVSLAAATGVIHLTATGLQAVGLVLLWFVLGFSFYSSAYAAVGARVSRQEELQGAMQPLNMLLMISYFTVFPAISNPNAPWVKIVAMIPPFSTILQPVRMSGGEVSWWEPVLAVVLMIGLTAVVIGAAARIYENSVLRFGSKVSLRAAWAGRKATA